MIAPFFLDTSIFTSRATGTDIDQRSTMCDKIFLHSVPKYTSMSVQKELDDVKQRRIELHSELDEHLALGNALASFLPTSRLESGRQCSRDLIALLATHVGQANSRSYMRALGRHFAIVLNDSIGRLSDPPMNVKSDHLMVEELTKKGLPYKDALIISDYLAWGAERPTSCFVTLDRDSVLKEAQIIIDSASILLGYDVNGHHILHARDAASLDDKKVTESTND